MNKDAAYIEETVEGGVAAYAANQNARYIEALASGDVGLVTRLNADAARVGFTLNPISGGGSASAGAGAGRSNVAQVENAFWPQFDSINNNVIGGGGRTIATDTQAVKQNLSDIVQGIGSAMDFLPMILGVLFVTVFVKAIFD